MIRNIAGPPVTGEDLFGRDRELSTLWRLLEQNQHVLMLAPRRVGKTSLMQELRRAPKDGWVVFYSDLERMRSASECVADMIAHLARHKSTRSIFEVAREYIPFRHGIVTTLRRIRQIGLWVFRIELSDAIGADWKSTADRLQLRLAYLPDGCHAMFILDELPYLCSVMLAQNDGKQKAEELLAWLRSLRQDPRIHGKVSIVIGGSIGLSGLLRRHNLSASINDLTPFSVEPWPIDTARTFLERLGTDTAFPLPREAINRILALLDEIVPYHVQLFFASMRDVCHGDAAQVSAAMVDRVFADRLAGPAGGPHLDHYAQRLEIMLPADEYAIARQILDLVCVNRNGINAQAVDSLSETLGRDLSNIVRLLIEDAYLASDNGLIHFRSNLLREYWRRQQRHGGHH